MFRFTVLGSLLHCVRRDERIVTLSIAKSLVSLIPVTARALVRGSLPPSGRLMFRFTVLGSLLHCVRRDENRLSL